MMGKRCNQTGRTVIGPDPTLKMTELAVPPKMAKILTIPIRVTTFNIDELQNLVNIGFVSSIIKNDKQQTKFLYIIAHKIPSFNYFAFQI